MVDAYSKIWAASARAFRPPPKMSLASFAEKNIIIPQGVSAQPGQLRLFPFQKGILDAIDDPNIRRVSVLKSARVGYSTCLAATLAGYVRNDPCPILMLLPTEADTRTIMVDYIEPLFQASPELRGLIEVERGAADRNTMMHRRFAGGFLRVASAKAPRNFRALNCRVVLFDEIDAYDLSHGEGDPIALGSRRAATWPNSKIIAGSTPLDEATSLISRLYQEGDQRVYEIPCVECGEFSTVTFSDLLWDEGKPETVKWRCPHCGSLVDERHKFSMVSRGRWRATNPEVTDHASFKLNCLISSIAQASWPKVVAEFLKAKNKPDTLKPFINTVLGEAWRDEGDTISENVLMERSEPISLERIPEKVLLLLAGVDVQDDRLEIGFFGFDREDEFYCLGHHIVWGRPDDDSTWQELDSVLSQTYPHPLGGRIGVTGCAVDSGSGGHADYVYDYTRPRLGRKIFAIKGVGGSRQFCEISKTPTKGCRLLLMGVDSIKSALFSRIIGGAGFHTSQDFDLSWYEQLCSERRVTRIQKGVPYLRFERLTGRRAEVLDVTTYAFGLRHVIRVNFDEIETGLRLATAKPKERPRVYHSQWMQR